MRVLIVEGAGNLWGSERALLDFIDRLPNAEVAVCCPPGRPLVAELQERGVRTYPYFVYRLHERSRWQRARAALGVFRACLRFRPDIVHLNQSGVYRVVLPAARLLGLPVVAHVRLFEDAQYLAARCPSPGRLRGILAISRAIEKEIRRFSALEKIPIHLLYDSYSGLANREVQRTAPERPRRLTYIGRLAPGKGLGVLIAAWPLLRRSRPALECVIAGDGDEEFVRELKAHVGSGNCRITGITWAGFVDNVRSIMAVGDVLACPSDCEAFGRVILEAWDAGAVPVVYAGSGGAAEIVAAAGGGIIYDEQTPEALADALQRALALDPHEASRLIERGRSWTFAHCDPQAYGEALVSRFRAIRA